MDCEWGITPFEKPVFPVALPPVGIINVPVCSKHTWDVINIARSGIFAADRAVREYAERIWEVHA